MTTAPNNNRVKTADWRARMEVTLSGVSDKLDELCVQVGGDRKDHSRRLDKIDLILAQQTRAEKEREKLREDMDALKWEQRTWTGIVSVVTVILGWLDFRR